jgi:hypothetical protein
MPPKATNNSKIKRKKSKKIIVPRCKVCGHRHNAGEICKQFDLSKGSRCGCTYMDESLKPKFDPNEILNATTIPTSSMQRDIIMDVLDRQQKYQVKEGESFYLVSQSWYRSWKNFVEYDVVRKGKGKREDYEEGGEEGYKNQEEVEEDDDDDFGPGPISNEELCCETKEKGDKEKQKTKEQETLTTQTNKELYENFKNSKTVDDIRNVALRITSEKENEKEKKNEKKKKKKTLKNNNNYELKPRGSILEGVDYIILPTLAFQFLYYWYGGGPIIERKAMRNPIDQTCYWVELYPLCVVVINDK